MGSRKSMRKRKIKRLKKSAESLAKRREEHLLKAENEKGRLDTTPEYWRGEARRFEEMSEEKENKAKELEDK